MVAFDADRAGTTSGDRRLSAAQPTRGDHHRRHAPGRPRSGSDPARPRPVDPRRRARPAPAATGGSRHRRRSGQLAALAVLSRRPDRRPASRRPRDRRHATSRCRPPGQPAGRLARPRPRDRNDRRHRRPHRTQLRPKLTIGRSLPTAELPCRPQPIGQQQPAERRRSASPDLIERRQPVGVSRRPSHATWSKCRATVPAPRPTFAA